jgi:hypothetical protein
VRAARLPDAPAVGHGTITLRVGAALTKPPNPLIFRSLPQSGEIRRQPEGCPGVDPASKGYGHRERTRRSFGVDVHGVTVSVVAADTGWSGAVRHLVYRFNEDGRSWGISPVTRRAVGLHNRGRVGCDRQLRRRPDRTARHPRVCLRGQVLRAAGAGRRSPTSQSCPRRALRRPTRSASQGR